MDIATPFAQYEGEVLPEWIDANGHMNLAYYVVLFDFATDALFAVLGIGHEYKRATDHGTFVAETHTLYERELLVGERVRVSSQILAVDGKRLHLAHEMFRLLDGECAAAQELMYLHVDLSARRVVPFPKDVLERLQSTARVHAGLPKPSWLGRRITMPT